MTPELPANGAADTEEPHEAHTTYKERQSTVPPAPRMSGAPRRDRRTHPLASTSGKHALPEPWPQRSYPTPMLAEDMPRVPSVTPEHWLPEPDYWLADHQRVPRPQTRPITRPQRFRKVSRARSLLLALIILIIFGVIGAGMVFAGRFSYDFFNTPGAAPTTAPTTAPTIPAQLTPTIPAKTP